MRAVTGATARLCLIVGVLVIALGASLGEAVPIHVSRQSARGPERRHDVVENLQVILAKQRRHSAEPTPLPRNDGVASALPPVRRSDDGAPVRRGPVGTVLGAAVPHRPSFVPARDAVQEAMEGKPTVQRRRAVSKHRRHAVQETMEGKALVQRRRAASKHRRHAVQEAMESRTVG